ncbi:MAG: lytic transglycosylase, partial [Marinobacter sp.]
MTVSRFSTLFLLGALASGCSALDPFTESSSSDVLASEKLTVAAGDDELKEAIESSPDDEPTGRASRTKLDDAIDPTLKKTAEDAREKLDEPDQKIAEENDATPDLWHRLRAGFELDHDASEPRVQAQLNWYKKHPRYIDRVVDRGSRYLHYILSEAEKRGLPTELALLPVVESAF